MRVLSIFCLILSQSCLVFTQNSQNSLDNFSTLQEVYKQVNLESIVNKVEGVQSYNSEDSQCVSQLKALKYHPDILLRMADSWSKFPYTGIFQATRQDFGDYDACVSIEIEKPVKIIGKHCTFGLVIPDLTQILNQTKMIEDSWKLSYCIPDACTAKDLTSLTGYQFFIDSMCSTKKTYTELDTGAIITLCIFIPFILLMILSTLYDVGLYNNGIEKGNSILCSFSILTNGKKLFAVSKNYGEQILCFHGLKFISMWWIIAGHGGVAWQSLPVRNDAFRANWMMLRSSFYIMTAHLAVDTFFYISGFLFAFLYFKNDMSKRTIWTQAKAVPTLIVHRYLRLTPAVLMTFIFVIYLEKYLGSGPLYSFYVEGTAEVCKKYWWSVFLYFQNYYIFHKRGGMCITTLWYLCADMQLFLVAPFIVIPVCVLYRKSFKLALAVLSGINLLFICLPIWTKLTWKEYDPINWDASSVLAKETATKKRIIKESAKQGLVSGSNLLEYDFHSRLIDYFIGVLMGIYMRHEKHKKFAFSLGTNVMLWTITLGTMLGVAIVTQDINLYHGYVARTIMLSFTRPIWCLCLCWITFACAIGRGGIVNWILSNGFMQIGGKMSYAVYLVHGPIISDYAVATRVTNYMSDWNMFYAWCGHFVVSMIVALFWVLAFEYPFTTINAKLFPRGPPRIPKTTEKKVQS